MKFFLSFNIFQLAKYFSLQKAIFGESACDTLGMFSFSNSTEFVNNLLNVYLCPHEERTFKISKRNSVVQFKSLNFRRLSF